jgi:preprotein translocase subunit YajC
MLISKALAATETAVPGAAATPGTGDTFMWNMGLVLVMFALFYVLMIRPQQKRLKAQQAMLGSLNVGDRVVTGGGLVGTISKIINDAEVEVDLGSTKVTALRYTLTTRITNPLVK